MGKQAFEGIMQGLEEALAHSRSDESAAVLMGGEQVEDAQQIIILTLSRTKISRNLSYPVGAEQISLALASTAQLPEIKLHFYSSKFTIGLRRGHFEFLRVEYLNNARPAEKWPVTSLFGRPVQSRWEIVVQPVPRTLRHRIKQYIIKSALSQIANWLGERKSLDQQGSDVLAFFYDEKSEEFIPLQLTHLEPSRDRGRLA
jgi:hypothetical protein